jgi:hypothetical protein
MPTPPTYHQEPFTICFDEVGNSFESFYSYFPEFTGELNTTLFSFKDGDIWAHTNSDDFCNFYGIQHDASITTVFNSASIDKKTWVSLMETGNTVWACPIIYTQMDTGGTSGNKQESELLESDFTTLESEYQASFLRDSNSPGGLVEGDSLKGNYIVVKFEKTSANSFVYLNSATTKYINSPLNNR